MDVQSAQVIFCQGYILLRCVFANRTLSRGCVFRFYESFINNNHRFFLPRNHTDTVLSQCLTMLFFDSSYMEYSVFNVENDWIEGNYETTPTIVDEKDSLNCTLAPRCETGKYTISLA